MRKSRTGLGLDKEVEQLLVLQDLCLLYLSQLWGNFSREDAGLLPIQQLFLQNFEKIPTERRSVTLSAILQPRLESRTLPPVRSSFLSQRRDVATKIVSNIIQTPRTRVPQQTNFPQRKPTTGNTAAVNDSRTDVF